MRITAAPDGIAERIGLLLNRLPTPLCVLELYDRPEGQKPDSGSILGLFFHLTSGADTYTTDQVSTWLGEAGFGAAEKHTFRTLPSLAMLSAKAA
jgi:hypothetical protein